MINFLGERHGFQDWRCSRPQADPMFAFALLSRDDWQNLDQFESGFAKLRKARDGQRQRRGHAQLA